MQFFNFHSLSFELNYFCINLLPHRYANHVFLSLSCFLLLLNRAGKRNEQSLLGGISLTPFLSFSASFFPPAFGCSPANFNTHHGMLGIVQQMPLRRTFLSGTTPLFTLFILKYLSPALIPVQHATRPLFSVKI